MRLGQNPAKFVREVARPRRVTVAVLSYVPFQSGFHEQSLEVLKACLNSLFAHTEVEHDLMVFDNGSDRETVDYLLDLQQAGRLQYLLLSERNLGKGGAWNVILDGAPGEIIAYSDCDAYFHPGWLGRSLELLDTYPRVGMVTARPFRTPPELFSATVEWAESTEEVAVERGSFIPWEVFREFDLSLGQEEEEVLERFQSTEDVRLTYQGVPAMAGGSHYQFVARKSVLKEFLPFEMDRPMGQVRELDRLMNERGYLRLMTVEPLMMNMSNTLIEVPASELRRTARSQGNLRRWILNQPLIKQSLLHLYNSIFRWYYSD